MSSTDQSSHAGENILIVGAGVFGLSTALELRKRGHAHITVLDRMAPPVPDGSSCDVSRIVRSDYIDPFYAQMATEAIEEWKSSPALSQFFYPTGYVLLTEGDRDDGYLAKLKHVQEEEQGQRVTQVDTAAQLVDMFPCLGGISDKFSGYVNPRGSWADAAGAVAQLALMCSQSGVSMVSGPRGTVTSLRISDSGSRRRILGVNTAAGPPLEASRVILATGAWTNHLLDLTYALSGTAQPLGFIQLTAAEAASLARMPVVMNTSTGFFMFPPTPTTHLLKVAVHGHGFETREHSADGSGRLISAPKVHANSNRVVSFMPDSAERALRQGLRDLLPRFAGRSWLKLRLCWYTDTPEADFVVDDHPSIQGLFVATGGSGHGFKFLPVLGRYVADCFEGTAPAHIRRKWRLREDCGVREPIRLKDSSRRGVGPTLLSPEERAKL